MNLNWSPCAAGSHRWERLAHYADRYKCSVCFAVGFHPLVQWDGAGSPDPARVADEIRPSRCPGCGGPTARIGQPCPRCQCPVCSEWRLPRRRRRIGSDRCLDCLRDAKVAASMERAKAQARREREKGGVSDG